MINQYRKNSLQESVYNFYNHRKYKDNRTTANNKEMRIYSCGGATPQTFFQETKISDNDHIRVKYLSSGAYHTVLVDGMMILN
jgi:hypothetical protein